MLNNSEIFNEHKKSPIKAGADKTRIVYQKPQLEELGDLRTLTLGGSPGVTDSGSGFNCENPYVIGGVNGNGSCP